jgi:dihydropteroate synthase
MQLRSLPQKKLICGQHQLDLSQPQVMGVLNVTPDSFSDGGRFSSLDQALKRAEQIVAEGGSIVDIGGESTRPNAAEVPLSEEMDRVLPVIEAISQRIDVIISIDTSSPELMTEAVKAGAHIWNDVRALIRPNALQTAVMLNIPVVLMHTRGEPATMNDLAIYQNVMAEVIDELEQRVTQAIAVGVKSEHIIVDAGFGFAKNTDQNLELLNKLWQVFDYFKMPMLTGLSRKRFLGEVIGGAPADQRLYAGLSAHFMAVQQGSSIIRTHDVLATVQSLKLWQAKI